MAATEMTPLDMVSLGIAPGMQATPDVIGTGAHEFGTMAIVPVETTTTRVPINEPSSLTLALIGVGTLVVYRGIQKVVAERIAPKAAAPKLIKPRRAA